MTTRIPFGSLYRVTSEAESLGGAINEESFCAAPAAANAITQKMNVADFL
jgi:hypothetical protein